MEEHRFMDHLRANGVGVPRIFAAGSGDTAIEIGESTYEVHGIRRWPRSHTKTRFRGHRFAQWSTLSSAGEMLARLHLAAESYGAPPRKPRPLVASFTIFASQDAREAPRAISRSTPGARQDAQTRSDCAEALDSARALP